MADDTWPLVSLEITPLGPFESWEDAWAALPTEGEGWVMTPDSVARFTPESGRRFLAAEVSHGPKSVHVRHDGDVWRAWRYTERVGETHEKRTLRFLNVEAGQGSLEYVEYWGLESDPLDADVKVWAPVAARFAGFHREED